MITKELKEKILNNIIQTDNGYCYKDFDAWNNNNGVIYASEYEIEDIEEDVDIDVFTKETWCQFVKEYIEDNYKDIKLTQEFVEKIAYDVFCNADWSCLTTLLYDYDNNNDYIEEMYEEYLS